MKRQRLRSKIIDTPLRMRARTDARMFGRCYTTSLLVSYVSLRRRRRSRGRLAVPGESASPRDARRVSVNGGEKIPVCGFGRFSPAVICGFGRFSAVPVCGSSALPPPLSCHWAPNDSSPAPSAAGRTHRPTRDQHPATGHFLGWNAPIGADFLWNESSHRYSVRHVELLRH